MDDVREILKALDRALHPRGLALLAWLAAALIGFSVVRPVHAASTTYEYDLRGNVSRIQQFGSSTAALAINAFSPNTGSPGVEVQIEGRGFSPSPAGNIIQFNGIVAPVLWASPTRLLASVPMQATTGLISVTTGGVTAQSDQPFIVSQLSRPPVITSLNPSKGPIGTVVQVLGNNLNPYPGQTVVQLNGLYVAPTFINDIQLVFTVPPYVGSGPVSVSTAFGVASASIPFIVTPPGVLPASLRPPVELAPGGNPVQATFNAAGQLAVFHFPGQIDDLITLRLGQMTSGAGSLTYTLYDPTNTVVSSGTLSSIATGLHPPRLIKNGTYSLMISGGSGAESFTVRMEKSLRLEPGSAPVDFAQEQSRRIAVHGIAGQNLGLGITNLVKINGSSSGSVRISITSPSGSSLVTATCAVPSCDVNLLNLPATGVYGVLLTSANWNQEPNMAMSFTAILSEEMTAALSPGIVESASIIRHGQNGRFSFQGTAGATLGLAIAEIVTAPTGGSLSFTVLKPDGSSWKTGSAAQGDGFTFNLANLPTTGTYQLLVDPAGGRPSSFKIRLVSASQAAVVTGEVPYVHPTTLAGETAFFSFQAVAGQNLGLALHDMLRSGSYNYSRITVYKPDGTSLTTFSCYLPLCDANLLNLPATGTYVVLVASPRWDLEPNWTVSFSATLSEEVTAALSAGTVESASITRQGQNGRFSFPGTAGTTLGLAIADIVTTPAGGSLNFTVLKPDGSSWKTGSATQGDGFTFNLANLPTTGTYQLLVDPAGGRTASFKMRLTTASQATVIAGDGPYLAPTTFAGETAFFSFQATAGQNLGLGLHDLVRTGGYYGYVRVTVYKPDGTALTTFNCNLPACDVNLLNLPATGTYAVSIASARWDLEPNWTVSFSATLSEEVITTLSAGTVESASITRQGQNGRFSFPGTAGTTLGIAIADIVTTPIGGSLNFTVLKPDGSSWKTGSATQGDGFTFNLANLPTTGTYQLLVDPAGGRTASFKMRLITASQAAVVAGDGPYLAPTTFAGETAFFSFQATAGQNLGLGLHDLIRTGGYYSYVKVTVYKPDGSSLTTLSCNLPACDVDLLNLPATGTYVVLITSSRWDLEPNWTMSFAATLSEEITAAMTPGITQSVDLARNGQDGRFSFSGATGATMAVSVADITTSQAGALLSLTVYKPDGGMLKSATTPLGGGHTFNLQNLPATGTYQLFVDPASGSPASFKVTSRTSSQALLTSGGSPFIQATTLRGESGFLAFSATSGQSLTLGISSLVKNSGHYSYVSVQIYKPDGAVHKTASCVMPGCNISLPSIPVTGMYTVILNSPRWDLEPNMTMSYSASLSSP